MHIISGLGIKARRLEPCAVKVARTVLRGLGEPQGSPGYPAGVPILAVQAANYLLNFAVYAVAELHPGQGSEMAYVILHPAAPDLAAPQPPQHAVHFGHAQQLSLIHI